MLTAKSGIATIIYKRGSDHINSKRRKLLFLGLFFFALMVVSGVYALTIQNTSAAINTGEVDIKIKFYQVNNLNEEVEY